MRVYLSGKHVVKVRTVSTFKTENTQTKKQYSAHQSLRTLERKTKKNILNFLPKEDKNNF